jgi:F0F1-type ATP synthase delta subunit
VDNKNINRIENDIYSTVYTRQDLVLFYKEMDQVINSIFKTQSSFSESSSAVLGMVKKEKIDNYLLEKKVDLNNPVKLKEALEKIKIIGKSFPVVNLTLAFEPTEKILKDVNIWFIKRLNTKVILEISLERKFIGGAYISLDGKYKDYSLEEKINKYFESKNAN